jgi:hypothetical protein
MYATETRNPVRPFVNPSFTGPVVLGKPSQWFNRAAFIAPPSASGFYGNAGRDAFMGPGLATWDLSVLKDTAISERLQLQFRAEMFNLLNRGSDHQHGHNGATNPIRPEAGLVDLRSLPRYGSSGLPSAFGSVKPTSFASVGAISIISITPSF